MRKEFGKWLMDIAKYITTAVILTSIFGEIEQKWIKTLVVVSSIIIGLVSGAVIVEMFFELLKW